MRLLRERYVCIVRRVILGSEIKSHFFLLNCCTCFSVLKHAFLPQLVFLFNCHNSLVSASACKYSSASKAFLFSLYNKNWYNPVKLTPYQNEHLAIYSCPGYGPTFGHHDIYISNNALRNSGSYARCGYTYSVPTGYSVGSCGFFTGGFHFTPTDIEVFYEIGNYS